MRNGATALAVIRSAVRCSDSPLRILHSHLSLVFTPDERRALIFLAVVAVAGGLVRTVRGPGEAPGSAALGPELPGQDLAAQLERVRRAEILARPLRPGERLDVDLAPAEQLDRLPGVGPALARRIVEDREANGPFGSLAGLDRVRGIGPTLLAGLEHRVSFSGVPRVTEVQAPSKVARPRGTRRVP